MVSEALVASLLFAAPAEFKKVEESDGVLIEARPVEGAKVVELRLTTTSTKTVASLCDAAFGDGKFDPSEPDLKARKVLSDTGDDRLTYEQISPPVVANRDYVVHAVRTRESDTVCRINFKAANEAAPALPAGWVRIEKLWGEWKFDRQADGKTHITYVIFSDPAGSVPAFMVEGSRRAFARKWLKLVLSRGKD